jgi:hypothetical protein
MCITDIRCLVASLEQVVINAEHSAGFKRFGKLAIQGCVLTVSSEPRPVDDFAWKHFKHIAVASA